LVLLLVAITATFAMLLAGAAVVLNWQPEAADDDTPLFHVALGLGWAFGLVPFIAFCVALFGKVPLLPGTTIAAALGVAAIAAGLWHRGGRSMPLQLQSGWSEARWVLLACGAVALVYLLKYDRSVFFLESCIHRVVMQTLQIADRPIDILSSNADDQRLGNTSVISSFVVIFHALGFRVLYAFVGFIIALGGFLLGRRVLGNSRWGWFCLFFLPLNPYVGKIPLLDENLLTLGYTSLFLPLMLRKSVPWAHVGALYGLAVMMRHVGILCVPAMLWAVWAHGGNRVRALTRGFLAFNLVTLVAHIHHYKALGSIFKFESFGQIPEFPHNIVGNYSGLLQWPFADHVLRTPWNPFPTFLMWPVYMADHLGLVLFAGCLIGIVQLVRTRPKEGIFWLAWLGLGYTALSLQENWDVPNKMGVIYMYFQPFILWAAVGIQAAVRAPKTMGTALVATSLVCGFGFQALAHYDAPVDTRYYEAWTGEREEDPAYVQTERNRVTDMAPWPDYGRFGPFARVMHPGKIQALLRDLSHPMLDPRGTPYGWFPGEKIDPAAPPLILELELGGRLFDATDPFLKVSKASKVHVDLTGEGPPLVIPNLRVDWSPRPVSLLISRGGADVTGISLIFEEWGDTQERREYLHERYHRGLMMVLGWGEWDLMEAKTVPLTGTTIVFKVPAGPFSLVESINNAGQNYLYWRAVLSASETPSLEGPYRVFHN
jgi:hypothetical protein